jgi:hypothetical protein
LRLFPFFVLFCSLACYPPHQVLGLNGQLPNLDLVNLVNRLVQREGMHTMFQVLQGCHHALVTIPPLCEVFRVRVYNGCII